MNDASEWLQPYVPGVHGAWTHAHAFHLLSRAGFGAPPDEVRRILDAGPVDAAMFLTRPLLENSVTPPEWTESWRKEREAQSSSLSEEERERLRRLRRAHTRDLQLWWIDRMIHSPQPFIEKLTLFWHSHFAVDAHKVRDPLTFFEHLQLFREHGTDDFRELVRAVCVDPAMVQFLDSATNVRGRPNENFARELMELYTLGEGRGYTERDVTEAARALTGWRVRNHQTVFTRARHDEGSKTFLGETGNWGLGDILLLIFAQPQSARFVPAKLFSFFVHENPSEEMKDALAERFRADGFSIRRFMAHLFSSRVFYSPEAYRSLVKSPVQLLAGVHRMLPMERPPPPASNLIALRAMGQHPLYPPDVDGWKEGDAWINSNSLMMRQHWLHFLATGEIPAVLRDAGRDRPRTPWLNTRAFEKTGHLRDPDWCVNEAALRLFGRSLPPERQRELAEYLSRGANNARVVFDISRPTSAERFRGVLYLMMSSPDFQLH